MSFTLANRVNQVKPSPTLALSARASSLKAEGKDVISLTVGEPDFDTPEFIKQAAFEAMSAGDTKYTPVDGTPALKQTIIDKFQRENNLSYTLKQILVSTGAKQSLYNMMQALLNDGDEVIILAPYWVSYPDMTALAGAKSVIIDSDLESNFKITPEKLEQAITPKTRLFLFNSPSNPSGMMYSEVELKALGDVLAKHPNIVIATDDIYEHIIWPGNVFKTLLEAAPELYDRTVVVNGVSKAYAMTGWRIGYCAGPEHLISAMKKIQSQSTSNPCSISQAASIAALIGDQTCITNMVTEFKKRHDYMVEALNQLPGVTCIPTDGTFYLFPNMQGVIDKLPNIENDLALGEWFINEVGIVMVPGSAFGSEGYMRLSIATSMAQLEKAIALFKSVLPV